MKVTGAILFVLATSLVGFDMSNRLTERTKQLRMFIYSLQLIEAEMTYSYHSLQQVFVNVSEKTNGIISTFYKELAIKLKFPINQFIQLWENELMLLQKFSMLQKEEIDILKQFGQNIGNHTIEQQRKQIKLTNFYLQKQLDGATEIKQKYDKTVKSLGVLIGLFIVLLLL